MHGIFNSSFCFSAVMWNLRQRHWSPGGSSSKQYGGLSVPTTNTRPVSLKTWENNCFSFKPFSYRKWFWNRTCTCIAFRWKQSNYTANLVSWFPNTTQQIFLSLSADETKHSVLLHVWKQDSDLLLQATSLHWYSNKQWLSSFKEGIPTKGRKTQYLSNFIHRVLLRNRETLYK
jgi:hypothetical protein